MPRPPKGSLKDNPPSPSPKGLMFSSSPESTAGLAALPILLEGSKGEGKGESDFPRLKLFLLSSAGAREERIEG